MDDPDVERRYQGKRIEDRCDADIVDPTGHKHEVHGLGGIGIAVALFDDGKARSRHLPHLRGSTDTGRADNRTGVSQGFKRNSLGMHGQKRLLHQPIELLVWEQTLAPDNRITYRNNSESHSPSLSLCRRY